jgi:hypothetical protein
VETKLSARPEFYQQRENIAYQLGTYFLANDEWDYAIVEITRTPSSKVERRRGAGRIRGKGLRGCDLPAWALFPGVGPKDPDIRHKILAVRVRLGRNPLDLLPRTPGNPGDRGERKLVPKLSGVPRTSALSLPPIKRSGVVSEKIYTRRNRKGGDGN